MSAGARLAGFAVVLAVLFGGGALAGGAIDPDRGAPAEEPHGATSGEEHGTVSAPAHTDTCRSPRR